MAKPIVGRKTDLRLPWLWQVALLGGIAVYVYLFFSQPSLLGINDLGGEPATRWADLLQVLLIDQLLAATVGNGRFEIGLLDRAPTLLAGLAWLGLAYWIGNELCRNLLSNIRLNLGERVGLFGLVGLAILSTITLAVGVSGALGSRWFLCGAIGAILIVLRLGNVIIQKNNALPRESDVAIATEEVSGADAREVAVAANQVGVWLTRLIQVAAGLLVALYVLGGLLTPWEFDVVAYHLQAIKHFYQTGVIGFSESNVYANMPLAAEMHGLAWMVLWEGDAAWWWGGLIGKFLIGSYSILAAILVGGITTRMLNSTWGFAAAGLVLAVPGNEHVAGAGLIDFAVASNLFGCVCVLILAYNSRRLDFGPIFIASVLGGGAAACKYPGLVFMALPLAVGLGLGLRIARAELRKSSYSIISLSIGLMLGLMLTCLPWLAKNAVLTGNPFYPLVNSVFPTPGMDVDQVQRWNRVHQVPELEGAKYGVSAVLSGLEQILLDSSFLNPVIWPLAGIAFMAFGRVASEQAAGRLQRLAILVCGLMVVWVFAVWWTATHRIERFWLPAIPFLAVAAALGAEFLSRRISYEVGSLMVLFGLAYGLFIGMSGAVGDNRFFVALEELRYDKGTDEFAGRVNPATVWLNQNVKDDDAKVLLVGEARAFDFEPEVLSSSCFNTNPGEALFDGKDPGEQRENLDQVGVTHILVNWSEIERYRSPGNYGFSQWPRRDTFERLCESGVLQQLDWSDHPTDSKIYKVLSSEQIE